MNHTPGPWIAGWGGDPEFESKDDAGPLNIVAVGRGGVAVCEPIRHAHASTWEIVEANATLIASAPDLLAALIITRGQWIHSVNGEQCLAAIARATGEGAR